MPRIALFGGSFDPVHLGHLLVAGAAREELALDRLVFIPAAQSPFKPTRVPAPADARLRMCRLALAGCDWAEVDDLELRRGGLSYTFETLIDYARRYANSELFYLIGADNVSQLPSWRNPQDLARLAEFVVVPRPGEPETAFPPPFRGRWLKGFPAAISSSEVRARVKSRSSIQHLVPAAVEEMIANSGLYL